MGRGSTATRWRTFHRRRKAGAYLLPYIALLVTAELILMLVAKR